VRKYYEPKQFFVMQLACKAMCKMLISIESSHELAVMHKDVACVSEAMLAFPLRLPWTRFYKGLQVVIQIIQVTFSIY